MIKSTLPHICAFVLTYLALICSHGSGQVNKHTDTLNIFSTSGMDPQLEQKMTYNCILLLRWGVGQSLG